MIHNVEISLSDLGFGWLLELTNVVHLHDKVRNPLMRKINNNRNKSFGLISLLGFGPRLEPTNVVHPHDNVRNPLIRRNK